MMEKEVYRGQGMVVGEEEEPIVSRLDRLDIMLKHLEEIKGYSRSPRSSYTSSPSTLTHTSDYNGDSSSVDSSPKKSNLHKHCRPIDLVVMEAQVRGSLIDRLNQVEDKLMKLCVEVEEQEREASKGGEHKEEEEHHHHHHHKKGLKQFVKSCVRGKSKHKK